MKILIHSATGDSAGLAQIFQKEGHKVSWFIKEKTCRELMKNIVPQVSSMVEGVKEKPDFILFDREGDGDLADRLKKAGLAVCCACGLADKMELDRAFGIKMMEDAGIKIPKTSNFSNVEEARAHVKKFPAAYAIKMDGNVSAASSYVAKDEKDMLDYIDYQKEMKLIKPGTKFVLQEVVKGVEISTEVWFSQGKPVQPFNSTFETKKFMPGDLGPNTGCETSIVFPYRGLMPKMVERTIAKVFPIMEKEKWTGPLDINCIVSDKDHEPYGLEWTVRLGYSAIYAWAAAIGGGIADFLHDIAHGKISRIPVKSSWGAALKISIPPYPLELPDDPETEKTIYEATAAQRIKAPEVDRQWLPIDAMKDEKGRLVTAGVNGIVGECLGPGRTLQSAWKAAQDVFEKVEVPNKMGRFIDGAERAWKGIKQMREWGYDLPNPGGDK